MAEPKGTIRAFLAVPADPVWSEAARALLVELRRELPEASWTKPESWHVTLCFLGEISTPAAGRFAATIAPEILATPEGTLASRGALVFPPRGPARVLAAGFADGPIAQGLGRIARAAGDLAPGTPKEKARRFAPHVTFARVRRPWPGAAIDFYRNRLEAWRPPAFSVRSCVLFQSRLDPGGAVHTPLETWSLAPAGAEVTG